MKQLKKSLNLNPEPIFDKYKYIKSFNYHVEMLDQVDEDLEIDIYQEKKKRLNYTDKLAKKVLKLFH